MQEARMLVRQRPGLECVRRAARRSVEACIRGAGGGSLSHTGKPGAAGSYACVLAMALLCVAPNILPVGASPVLLRPDARSSLPGVSSPVATTREGANTLPPPIIATNEAQGQRVVRSSVGITIVIARPVGVHENNTAIYYALQTSEEQEVPSCGVQDDAGKFNSPTGQEYESSLHFCGDDSEVTVLAILCPHGVDTGDLQSSEVASKTLDIRRYEPEPPLEPVLEPVVDSTCTSAGAAGFECTVTDESEEAQLVLSVADYVCSDPRYGTMAECGAAGFAWEPMDQCQRSVERKPCMDLFYTLDGR
jgi:hypothetical protein